MGGQLRACGKVEYVSDQENQRSPCQNIKKVKTGLPGVAWVKLKDDATWPDTVPVPVSL